MAALNNLAKTLKSLHVPGKPIIIANVYDILSAQAVAGLPSAKAIGTASFGVARANGTEDDDMTMEMNLNAVSGIGKVVLAANKPLTVDAQDAYGENLENAIKGLIERGAVGINLEDCDKDTKTMYNHEEAVKRIQRALAAAKAVGVPDFVVNARCDTLIHGGELEEVILRGRKYLAAGATSVFVWGGSKRGVSRKEVERMVKDFDGRLNVSLKMSGADSLTIQQLAEIGVSRISIGPQIQFIAMEHLAQKADTMLKGESTH